MPSARKSWLHTSKASLRRCSSLLRPSEEVHTITDAFLACGTIMSSVLPNSFSVLAKIFHAYVEYNTQVTANITSLLGSARCHAGCNLACTATHLALTRLIDKHYKFDGMGGCIIDHTRWQVRLCS